MHDTAITFLHLAVAYLHVCTQADNPRGTLELISTELRVLELDDMEHLSD